MFRHAPTFFDILSDWSQRPSFPNSPNFRPGILCPTMSTSSYKISSRWLIIFIHRQISALRHLRLFIRHTFGPVSATQFSTFPKCLTGDPMPHHFHLSMHTVMPVVHHLHHQPFCGLTFWPDCTPASKFLAILWPAVSNFITPPSVFPSYHFQVNTHSTLASATMNRDHISPH